MLESADPAQARGEEVSVREVLDQASGRIHAELADQPDVRAKMDAIIGIVYTSLAKYGEAEPFLARALELQRDQHGPNHRSEEHTSELQSLMRISYAVFC